MHAIRPLRSASVPHASNKYSTFDRLARDRERAADAGPWSSIPAATGFEREPLEQRGKRDRVEFRSPVRGPGKRAALEPLRAHPQP
jgi:hypothetical protein